MDVPYFDLKEQYRHIRDEILAAVDRVCHNSSFALGEEVARFEEEFSAFCGVKHCVAVNSGTSALHLALLAVGAGAGGEVITTPNTFIATAEAISYTGATPVFVDIDPATGNISPEAIKNALSDRTRAILPVHLYGRPADLGPILEVAGRRGVAVVEDACQAHGARYGGARVGTFGHASAFSFYPGKNLGAYGEGGALTTGDDRIARLARTLRNHGEGVRYRHDLIGYNYRMDGFQGAVLRVKLKYLERWTARRLQIARLYREQLQGTRVEMPRDDAQAESVYHLFVIWVEDRDAVRDALQRQGVQTAIHYPLPLHLQKAYAPLGHRRGSFPNAERACDRALTLPLFPEMTDEQVRYVAAALTKIVGTR
ncbi:MAG: DegT/DnrJ/EryC1/StrS family aminotransferase [Acidobacteria bacterium]|nr:DegT/DnrJ/EryC1/StrS family aminotransferase [Acidobacteriota bacterium]